MKNNSKIKKEDVLDAVGKIGGSIVKGAAKVAGGIVGGIKGIGDQYKKSRDKSRDYVGKESTKAKPDFLDADKDGNKKESMKKALKDKKNAMRENTINFIKHVTNNDFKKADSALAAIVNEKIKQRIAVANQNLSTHKGNK
jgi:hypothetical protein